MGSPEITDELAERMVVELDVLKIDFKRQVAHLKASIGIGKEDLHPILQARLPE